MSRLRFAAVLLAVCVGIVAADIDPDEGITRQSDIAVWSNSSRSYPCMEDWAKVCSVNTDCCSGECINGHYCKVLGLEIRRRRMAKRATPRSLPRADPRLGPNPVPRD